MNKLKRTIALSFCPGIALLLLIPSPALADASADSQLSYSDLTITPDTGNLVIQPAWQGSAFAQATISQQYINNGLSPMATANGDYSSANGSASAPSSATLAVSGSATANASILGQIDASDAATARGTVVDSFMISGPGRGAVNVSFSTLISGSLSAMTDIYGQAAYAETVFTLQLDGNPLLFDDRFYTIGASDNQAQTFSQTLTESLVLQYNTPYSLYMEADAETSVLNSSVPIPEPKNVGILAALLALGTILLPGRFNRNPMRVARKRAVFFFAGAVLILPATPSFALYIGADAPYICEKCGYPVNRQSGGTLYTSLTEGNLREDFSLVTFKSGSGPTLDMTLTYNSYNADASRAQVDCGLGLGWTHSYNIFLFEQRNSFFRMGPDGRVTLFHFGAGGSYTADSGFFETLTPLPGGELAITNKEKSWWLFASVPQTPFLVGGPVYRLVQMGDRNHNVTTLSYAAGLLTQISDTYGRTLHLAYTGGKLTSVTDPLGRTTTLQYDPRNRSPIRITDPAGQSIRYSYNSLYQISRKIDRDGRTYLYLYRNQEPYAVVDGNGQTWFAQSNPTHWGVNHSALAYTLRRVYQPSTVSNRDGNGNLWSYQYDTNGYIDAITAPNGTITSYGYDRTTRELASVTDANGNVTRYEYDAEGNRTNRVDPLGNVTTYTYEPLFNQLSRLTDPNGRVTTYQYDAHGNRTNEIDPLGYTTRYTYDAHGNLLSLTDKNTNTTTFAYDEFGNRTNLTDPLGHVTSYGYDAVGNQISVVDPLGHTTRYAYDALDREIGVTNALGGVTRYTYDAAGRELSVTDPNTNTTSYQYDVRGRLTQTTDALGGITRYTYDADNNRIVTTTPLGHTTSYAYDAQDRVIGITNGAGGITRYTYDPVGNIVGSVDPNSNTMSYAYDALDRRIGSTNALGGVNTYDYSTPGGPPCCSPTIGSSLITRSEDADGHVTFYHYDALDRRVEVIRKNSDTNDDINPIDAVTTTTYDPAGNVIAVTDPAANTTTTTYDANNRWIKQVDAVGDITVTSYDADGNVILTVTPNLNNTVNVYDPLNRVITVYDDVGIVRTNTYDSDGNALSATDGLGHTTSYTYDALNRNTATTDALGRTTTTVYDADGNVTSTIDRNGHTTTYLYDGLDRQTNATDALSHLTTTTYDADDNITSTTDADGHLTRYGYDGLNRRVTETYPDAAPNTRTNIYDGVGNLIESIDQAGRSTSYYYNDLNYLTNRTYLPSGTSETFIYDNAGRMLSADRNGWVDTFIYDGVNRPTNTVQNGLPQSYTYDVPGRVETNIQPSGRILTYSYDARNRLTSLQDGTPNPPITTYSYDDADRVTAEVFRNGATATTLYDADDQVISLEESLSSSRIVGFGYTYDHEGNTGYEQKLHSPADSESYAYDALNRLDSFGTGTLIGSSIPTPSFTETWNLDPAGNWNSVTRNSIPETRTFGPVNELQTVDAQTYQYDAVGNLIQDPAYRYAYDEENRLTQVERTSDSTLVGQYFYDALGRRIMTIEDASGSPETNVFLYNGVQIIEELDGGGSLVADYTYGNNLD